MRYFILFFWIGCVHCSFGQKLYTSMTPLLNEGIIKMEALESQDRYVVKSVFDILFKEVQDFNNSVIMFVSKEVEYKVYALAEKDKVSKITVKQYTVDVINGKVVQVKTYTGNYELSYTYTPPNDGYGIKLEVTCEYLSNERYTHYGIIVDREN